MKTHPIFGNEPERPREPQEAWDPGARGYLERDGDRLYYRNDAMGWRGLPRPRLDPVLRSEIAVAHGRAARSAEAWAALDEEHERAIERWSSWRGLTERYHEARDLGFPRRALDEAATADIRKPAVAAIGGLNLATKNIVLLTGRIGCGKTVAATWWMLHNQRMRYVTAPAFARSSRYGEQRDLLFDGACGLVFDDLGVEFLDDKGSFAVDVNEMIDVFYSSKLALIVTTNLTTKLMAERYGIRIRDRLLEAAHLVGIDAPSLRGAS
jgi:DNA replication protein DnaC